MGRAGSRAKAGDFTMSASRRPMSTSMPTPAARPEAAGDDAAERAGRSRGRTPRASSPPPAALEPAARRPSCPRSPSSAARNAGKSTAINVARRSRSASPSRRRRRGARSTSTCSSSARRTRADALFADLPGYGYAAVERDAKLRWQEVMAEYLAVRRSLSAIVRAGRLAPRLHRPRPQAARLRRAAPGQRLGEAARAADQGRQAQPPRRATRRCRGRERRPRRSGVRGKPTSSLALFSALEPRRRRRRRARPVRLEPIGARR